MTVQHLLQYRIDELLPFVHRKYMIIYVMKSNMFGWIGFVLQYIQKKM